MADTAASCCFGAGFDVSRRICAAHLEAAYEWAKSMGDKELMAVIVLKATGRLK